MTYREPGAYLTVQNAARGIQFTGIEMFPLIIGSGATKLKKVVQMTRGATSADTLPFTSVASISKISITLEGPAYYAVTTDYTFVPDSNTITWVAEHGPSAGAIYYVTLVHHVEDSQYGINLCTSANEVTAIYGPDYQEAESGTPLSKISAAAQLALSNGAPAVYCLQVEAAGSEPTGAEYAAALAAYAAVTPAIWRVIPVDVSDEINTAVINHVNATSTWEERMERTGLLGVEYTTYPTAFTGVGGVLNLVGTATTAIKSNRISVCYPDRGTLLCSDGTERSVDSQMIWAAFSGAEQLSAMSRGRTRMQITGIKLLGGVTMTRSQMNQLAEKGVMILTQAASGQPFVVRHQLTTDYTSLQTREMSLIAIQDYASKFFRNLVEQYIGRYTVNPELLNMVTAALKSGITQLQRDTIIISGEIRSLYQDEANPDTIIVNLAIAPPYPFNYIDITLYVQ